MKKFLSVLLIISLLILPIKTFAATDAPPSEISDTPFDIVSENENTSVRAAAEGITSGYIYNIKNVNSGKYLNVHNGVDADGTNVYQWTKDGSPEQNFKIIYTPSTDSYTLHAMCSSNGNFRVVNIHIQRGVEPLASGQNVNLWDPDAAYTQQFILVPQGQNQYRIATKHNPGLYLTVNDLNNGSSGGTAPTSPGNIYLCDYVGAATQLWVFEPVGPAPEAVPRGHVESVDSTGVTGWVWNNSSPDSPVEVHIYVTDNYGNQYVYTAIANIYRQDLYNCGYGNGYHGFHCPIDWTTRIPRTYTIRVYGIGGGNPILGNSPTTFNVRECFGYVDEFTSTGIYGWVWKPDAPQSAITVHLYIHRMNGEEVGAYVVTANQYRADVQAAGYGTGNYGYHIPLDYASLPEEQLRVTAYAVDGSNYNNSFWSGIYDNRRPINLIGMIDNLGRRFNTTYNTTNVTTWCQNIGCTAVNRFSGAQKNAIINRIKEASFCVVNSHGGPETIFCYLGGVKQENHLESSDINALADGYFNGTRCVLVAACWCGQDGAAKPDNIVNRLHQKGVESVVGFETPVYFIWDKAAGEDFGKMDNELGAPKWYRKFIQQLSMGDTINEAIQVAYTSILENLLEGVDENGIPYPSDYGLGSVYVAGNANQVVKH